MALFSFHTGFLIYLRYSRAYKLLVILRPAEPTIMLVTRANTTLMCSNYLLKLTYQDYQCYGSCFPRHRRQGKAFFVEKKLLLSTSFLRLHFSAMPGHGSLGVFQQQCFAISSLLCCVPVPLLKRKFLLIYVTTVITCATSFL